MASSELIIKPRKGWQPVDFKEVYMYRDLFAFLVWRDVKVRYRQTLLGGAWAVIQPLVAMLIFTVVFHRLAGVNSAVSAFCFCRSRTVDFLFYGGIAIEQQSRW